MKILRIHELKGDEGRKVEAHFLYPEKIYRSLGGWYIT